MTNQTDIKKLAEQMASSMNSFDDIKYFQKQLMQSFIETAIEAKMEDHFGYPKHKKADKPNKRNGHTKKTVRSDNSGTLEIFTSRDRASSFDPVLVSKHQTRISDLDDKIIFHYRHSLLSYASGNCPPNTCFSSLICQRSNHD